MIRKLVLLVVLVAAAVVFGLWRAGVLDEGRLKDEAAELRERAEKSGKRAAEGAIEKGREAIDDARRR
jgi:hypothetical protein